jgi:hypothetical protein
MATPDNTGLLRAGRSGATSFAPWMAWRITSNDFQRVEPMSIVRMTDLDLSGKRVLIRQGEPA